jgi:hypothetical protein
MRQGQQNRRGRGRNRKGQSPLTRSFESTGPDVKIRGTPAHIAEKYMSLARDASSSGDPVLAENYLQHAEHYNRIIMAFREQHMGPNGEHQMNGQGMNRNRQFMPHDPMDPGDEFDEDGDEGELQQMHSPARHDLQPQPRLDNQHHQHNQRFEGGQRGGHDQHRFRDRPDRQDHRHEHRQDNRQERQDRPDRQDRGFQPPRPPNGEANLDGATQGPDQQRRRDRFVQSHEQPEFLRRPVRRPRREGNGAPEEANGGTVAEDTDHD